MRRIVTALVVVWLLIGVLAAWQRGYFEGRSGPGCERVSTTAVTVLAGPLNYAGMNPKVQACDLPEPSR
jgi:hypothetical protein